MNTFHQVIATIDYMVPESHENKVAKAYILRRVMNMKPKDVAKYLQLSTPYVNILAKEGRKRMAQANDINPSYRIMLESCQKCVTRQKKKQHREHLMMVLDRLNKNIIQTA